MEDYRPIARFFMGANTPRGFYGFLEDVYCAEDGWRALLIKGGPGCGKSSLMRRLAQRMANAGQTVEEIRCSSDPYSLDGVVFRESKQCILDATAPHVIEPRCWDAVESILPLDTCIRADEVAAHRKEVMALTADCTREHARARRFLGAAASLLEDSWKMAAYVTDTAKVRRSAARFVTREFGMPQERRGKEWRRFLSAVTPEGLTIWSETLGALCPRIIAIEDEAGVAAPLFLQEVKEGALAAGYDCFTCFCPLAPERLEHVLVPAAGLALTLSNGYHKADFPVYRRLHTERFTDPSRLRDYRPRLSFHRRVVRELIGEAANAAAMAKAQHDILEKYYVAAMDWTAVEVLENKVWQGLAQRL